MKSRKVVGPDGAMYPEGTTFSDVPLDPREIATDENLSLAAAENQLRAKRDERDPHAMTLDKLSKKTPGMGHATLHLPDGLAQHYDLHKWREEDEEILRQEQSKEASKE